MVEQFFRINLSIKQNDKNMNTDAVNAALQVGKGISDFGMVAIAGAFFLIICGVMWLFIFKWFKHLVDNVITRQEKVINDLLVETKAQNEVLSDINEGLKPISQMQINSVCNNFFDLDCERLCRLVRNVRDENNIDDKQKTRRKIETRCNAIIKKRSIELDNFIHRGKRLSEFMSTDWVKKFSDIIESEIYNPVGANNARAYANIKTAIDEAKVEFFNNMNKKVVTE